MQSLKFAASECYFFVPIAAIRLASETDGDGGCGDDDAAADVNDDE